MKRKASEQDLVVRRDREDPSTFYNTFKWKQICDGNASANGRILRTIYCQFGKWCVEKKYLVQETDHLTKLCWFKRILPYLCC